MQIWRQSTGRLARKLLSALWKWGAGATSVPQLFAYSATWDARHRKAMKELAEEAEKGRFWLWLRKKHKSWGANNT